ncbi:hypothetical protein D9M69_492280 [compost metagenome]
MIVLLASLLVLLDSGVGCGEGLRLELGLRHRLQALSLGADAVGPGVHAFLDQGVGVLEGGAALAVGVGDFAVVLPFAEQEGLAACLGGDLGDALQVAFFHHQDQIGLAQQAGCQLAGTMLVRLLAVLLERGQGLAFDGLVDQGAETGGADLYVSTM